MKNIYIVLAFVALVGIAWIVFGNFSDTTNTVTTEQSAVNETQKEVMTLSVAQETIGMECEGSNVGMDCKWNEIEYGFLVPASWENDQTKRVQACDQGYINESYNMVSDGSTWYATTNFEKDNTTLVGALNEVGFESRVISYCR